MKKLVQHLITVVVVLVVILIGLGVFVYSGIYNIGADDPHTEPVHAVLQTLRERSIHVRSNDIEVPNLEDPRMILEGAGHYAAMCSGCHLRPGQENSELREGMYPQPPNLSRVRVDPSEAFWVIKHGIKMSAMPAWGVNHDDPTVWSMVAFLQKLPDMTPQQYKAIVARAPPDEDMDMGGEGHHSHGAAAEHSHDHRLAASPAADATRPLGALKPGAAPEAEAVAQAFQNALQHGDRTAVLALLAPDATISEAGHTESRDDYASGHLGNDIAFLKAAKVTLISMGSMSMGDTAMVGSKSSIQATIKGKAVTLRSRERLKLRKDGDGWKIVSVQWHSEPVTGK